MVAFNHECRRFDPAQAVFSEEVLAEVAEMRAHGRSWEETASAVGWGADDLRKALRDDPNYRPALARARREARDEADDEGLARLRKLTADEKPEVALDAHRIIRKYLAEKDRNRTRRMVERMRYEASLARARAKPAKPQEVMDEDAPRVDPVDGGPMCSIREEREMNEARAQLQQELAAEIADAGASVWLWAGDHKVHDHKPGPNDTPLRLVPTTDASVAGRRIFWAVPVPEPADSHSGPYLRSEQCKRLPPVEEEVWQRILRRHKEGRDAGPPPPAGGVSSSG